MDQELHFKIPIKEENADRDKVRLNKRVFIYLFFLIISIIFWYLNALSKNYTTNISYKVEYQNFPKGKILLSDLPIEITIKARGVGFQILKFKINSIFESLPLNLNEFRIDVNSNKKQYDYFLLTKYTMNRMKTRFKNIEVLKINPDTLFFRFTDVYEKKLPVKPTLQLSFEKQYLIHGNVIVIPDSVTVSGPIGIIDTIRNVYTNAINVSNVKDTMVVETDLIQIPNFIVPKNKFKVFVPVDKFTEANYSVPIDKQNLPGGIDIKTFPSQVTVSCLVAVTDFDKVNEGMFSAVIDYNDILELKPEKLKVNLIKYPSQIYNIKYHPKTVEYIIEK